MNKPLFISILLLLMFFSSAVMAASLNDTAIDTTGKSVSTFIDWTYGQMTNLFWGVVMICVVVGGLYIVFGGSSSSATGQKKIMYVIEGVAAVYICLWAISSIKAL